MQQQWRRKCLRLLLRSFSSEAAQSNTSRPLVFKAGKPVPLIYPWLKKWRPLRVVNPDANPAALQPVEEDESFDDQEESEHIGRGRKSRRKPAFSHEENPRDTFTSPGRKSKQLRELQVAEEDSDDDQELPPVDSNDEAEYEALAQIVDEEDEAEAAEAQEAEDFHLISEPAPPRARDSHRLGKLEQIIQELEHQELSLDSSGYASLLQWCGNTKSLHLGRRLVAHLHKTNHIMDRYLRNMLVEMFGKCGALDEARQAFLEIQKKNVFSWTILIASYTRNGRHREALALLAWMDSEGTSPNTVTFVNALAACAAVRGLHVGRELHDSMATWGVESDVIAQTSLLNMYGKCGGLVDARRAFAAMTRRDVVAYNAMMWVLAQLAHGREAVQLMWQMDQDGVAPDEMTYGSLLAACEKLLALRHGAAVHRRVEATVESDVVVGTALVSLYGKCGRVDAALEIFHGMPQRNVATWTAAIGACSLNGRADEALELFRQMDVRPDAVTLSAVVPACGEEDARRIFRGMVRGEYPGNPAAVVEVLGQNGRLGEAESLIQELGANAGVELWGILARACKRYGDCDREARAMDRVAEVDPQGKSLREPDEVGKFSGRSWLELRCRIYEIEDAGFSNPVLEGVREELKRFSEEYELGRIDCWHSEKLAVGLALFSGSKSRRLRVVKSVRACPDCHEFIKHVSKLCKRHITLRDSTRFHHIEKGSCSCRDIW